jgi:hypothetical protein
VGVVRVTRSGEVFLRSSKIKSMLEWFRGKKKNKNELPVYSRLESIPSRELPAELKAKEVSESYLSRRDNLERELLEPARRPPNDQSLFTTLLATPGGGVLTISSPEGAMCLPVFSTPVRAADYVQTLLAAGPATQYLCSSPLEFIRMLQDLKAAKIENFTLDRCPRCSAFVAIGINSIKTDDDTLAFWAISKATELARADLYFAFALESARAGRLEGARDVALETIGHVTMEDPRPHLLLGNLGVGLRDQNLIQEAKSFLSFLKLDEWERKLDEVVRSNSPDFTWQ